MNKQVDKKSNDQAVINNKQPSKQATKKKRTKLVVSGRKKAPANLPKKNQ